MAKLARKRTSTRTWAAGLAAAGALVLSSGLALLVTATPAHAATKVPICHATSSDTNPYTFILVDDDSKKFVAHLAHRNDPNKSWKSNGTFNGEQFTDGQPKPDIIGNYMKDGQFVEMDGEVTSARCNGEVEVPDDVPTTASVEFVDPSCENGNVASYATAGEHVDFAVTEGSAAPGASITVTASAQDGFYLTFEGDPVIELDFSHDFPAAEENCSQVNPPDGETPTVIVDPPTDKGTTTVTPTLVSAGLGAEPADDLRGERAVALLAAGTLLLVVAGGLGLRRRTGSSTR